MLLASFHAAARHYPDLLGSGDLFPSAPIASPVRAAVNIVNSRARAAMPPWPRSATIKSDNYVYSSAVWCFTFRTLDRAGKSLLRCPRQRAGLSPLR